MSESDADSNKSSSRQRKPKFAQFRPPPAFHSNKSHLRSRNTSAPHYHSKKANAQNRELGRMTTEEEQGDLLWEELDIGGVSIKNVSIETFDFTFLTGLYLNHNMLTHIPSEIGQLIHLKKLDLSGNRLQSLPFELSRMFTLRKLLVFDNQISTLATEFGSLYLMESFGIDGNPLVEPLFSINASQGGLYVLAFLRDNNPLPPPSSERVWRQLDYESGVSDAFRLLNYNILSDKYATQQSHGYTPSWALDWDYRKELILQEILLYNSDIICLQEVETVQYEEFFRDQLRMRGDYEGIFWPKSRAKTMAEWDRKHVDGCAIFYKSQRFKLEERFVIEFSQVALEKPKLRSSEDAFTRIMNRDNIAVVARFEQRETKRPLIITNVHIHWDPSYKDAKLLQAIMLTEELAKLESKYPRSAMIVCGDFNSLPDSGVYELMQKGSIKPNHPDFCKYTYEPYSSTGYSSNLNLEHAYVACEDLGFTNCTPFFKGIIDYIFYKPSVLTVAGLLGPIAPDYFDHAVGLPSPHFPSDHIPLLVEFRTKKNFRKGASNKSPY